MERTSLMPAPPDPLRLDLVTETWPPEVNGVAMTLSTLVAGLRARGHDVTVVRPRQPADGPARASEGTLLRPGLPLLLYSDLRLGWPCARFLARRWTRRRPDVVHLATEGPLGWSALAAARRMRLPVTSSFHTNFHAYSRHYGLSWLAGWVERRLADFHARCDATLVPSKAVAEALESRGVGGVALLGRGVNTAAFAPSRRTPQERARLGLAQGALGIVCVGRLATEKNLGLALKVLHAVAAEHSGTRLVLVGDGPLRGRLAREPGVVLAGALPHHEVGVPLAAGDLFVFPSLTETFGNVLLEALAAGLPSVSFRYAASARHVQDGQNGLQAEPGDDAGFVAAALRLARDPGLRERLGAAGRATALEVGWDPVVDGFEAALRRVAALGPRADRARPRARPCSRQGTA